MRTISTWSRVIGRLPPVTNAPNRDEAGWTGRVRLDLLPEAPYVHGDGGLVPERPAPDLCKQLVAGERGTGVGQQEPEQIELAARQGQLLAGQGGGVSGRVDDQVAVVDRGVVDRLVRLA